MHGTACTSNAVVASPPHRSAIGRSTRPNTCPARAARPPRRIKRIAPAGLACGACYAASNILSAGDVRISSSGRACVGVCTRRSRSSSCGPACAARLRARALRGRRSRSVHPVRCARTPLPTSPVCARVAVTITGSALAAAAGGARARCCCSRGASLGSHAARSRARAPSRRVRAWRDALVASHAGPVAQSAPRAAALPRRQDASSIVWNGGSAQPPRQPRGCSADPRGAAGPLLRLVRARAPTSHTGLRPSSSRAAHPPRAPAATDAPPPPLRPRPPPRASGARPTRARARAAATRSMRAPRVRGCSSPSISRPAFFRGCRCAQAALAMRRPSAAAPTYVRYEQPPRAAKFEFARAAATCSPPRRRDRGRGLERPAARRDGRRRLGGVVAGVLGGGAGPSNYTFPTRDRSSAPSGLAAHRADRPGERRRRVARAARYFVLKSTSDLLALPSTRRPAKQSRARLFEQ